MTWNSRMRVRVRSALCCGLVLSSACSLSDLVNNSTLPSDVRDPSVVKNQEGALSAYRNALVLFAFALAGSGTDGRTRESYVYYTGVLSDELRSDEQNSAGFPMGSIGLVDTRKMLDETPESSTGTMYPYAHLHKVRGQAREARGALRKYAPGTSVALQGHLYAIEGMAEVMLAELYCSGIPLSTLEFEGDFTPTRGFSTDEVYRHALALFDSASQNGTDSVRFLRFAQVGRARALAGLGEYEAAAQAVATVPDSFQYTLSYADGRRKFVPAVGLAVIADREGENGLPFSSSADPRVTRPALTNTTASLILASGVEARLIEAEAALAADRADWLTLLNRVRTSCTTSGTCPTPAPAGTGGIANLPLLTDPALSPLPEGKTVRDVRVDLVFNERAYWLLLTGHRQGDLRRLVRQYVRPQFTVYPTGLWGPLRVAEYGSDVNMPVPVAEQRDNIFYRGCVNRDA